MKITKPALFDHRRVSFVLDDPERGDARFKEDAEKALAEYLEAQNWLAENTDPFARDEEIAPEKMPLVDRYRANPFTATNGITVTIFSGPYDYHLNFGEALDLLKAGCRVYREDWGTRKWWLELDDDGRICLRSEDLLAPFYTPSHDDIFSNLWALRD